jgi:hypothetical protein
VDRSIARDVIACRRRIRVVRVAAALLFVATAAGLGALPARASCLPTTPVQQRARADVIFEGRALDAPTATGVQRFRVLRYLQGRGPTLVRVQTGYKRRADGTGSITSVSIVVNRGERWRIFAQRLANRPLRTSVCDGSRRV